MSNLIQRTITGIIFIAVVVASIILHKISFLILFELIILGSMYEFYTLAEKKNFRPQKVFGIFIGIVVFALNFFYVNHVIGFKWFLILIPLFMLVFIFELYRKSEYVFVNVGFTLLGVIYIAIPFSFANYIVFHADISYHWELLIGFLVIMWAYDTLAYVFGISFGKHRLFERISPKKSWEGFIGGTLSSIAFAYLVSLVLPQLGFLHWAVLSVIVAVFGTFGDLVESSFKRNIDEKDSGNILPGHGGILDRFDAVLFTLPLFFVYLQIIS